MKSSLSRNLSNVNYNTKVYNINFDGKIIKTTVTNDPRSISSWIDQVVFYDIHKLNTSTVGLDIEWNRINSPNNKVATLQLCVDTKCLIVQLTHLDYDSIYLALEDFLVGMPRFTFVGDGVMAKVARLGRDYDLACLNTKDIGATGAGCRPGSVNLSNWNERVLSEEQVYYACINAYAAYKIGHNARNIRAKSVTNRCFMCTSTLLCLVVCVLGLFYVVSRFLQR